MAKAAITIVSGLIGVGIGAAGMQLLSLARPTTPAKTAVVAATPPAFDARPALQALQALRSIVQASTTFQNYSTKVGDVKVEVDRYLRAAPEGPQRESIDLAMRYYVAASTAWSMTINHQGYSIAHLAPALGHDPRLSECSIVRNIREDKATRESLLVALNIPPFWGCAFAKTAEAEKLLAKP